METYFAYLVLTSFRMVGKKKLPKDSSGKTKEFSLKVKLSSKTYKVAKWVGARYEILNPVVFCPKRNDVPLAIMIDLTCRLKAWPAPFQYCLS